MKSDYLPAMKQEAIDLRELAKAADRPGMGDMMRQIAEGYEAACYEIERLQTALDKIANGCCETNHPPEVCNCAAELARLTRKDDHGKTGTIEGYECSDPMDV